MLSSQLRPLILALLFYYCCFSFVEAFIIDTSLRFGSGETYSSKSELYGVKKIEQTERIVDGPTSLDDNMKHVSESFQKCKVEVSEGLSKDGYAIVDNFLGAKYCKSYRQEAEGYYSRGGMSTSQSTRWDSDRNAAVAYDKLNVKSVQLLGGEEYEFAPRLHEYVVSMIKAIAPELNTKFPCSHLSESLASNKLGIL